MIWRGCRTGRRFVYMARTGLSWAFLGEIPPKVYMHGLYINVDSC